MKTIVAVIFLGIFTYAFGNNYAEIRECQTVRAMQNFDSTKFFRGSWYMTHVMNGLFSFVCQKLQTTKDGAELFIDYNYEKNGKQNNVRCESKGQNKNGQIPFNCQIKNKQFFNFLRKSTKFQSIFTIMTTDYDNYALFYKCVTLESGAKAENYVLLSRNKYDENIPGNAKSLLEINGVNLKKCSELRNAKDIDSEVV
uniref:Triatin-like salivary lipocalin n=1 Tax=Panstrongylus lignarius TaxID=156445 RepID=A0A224XX83_9HEMI